MHPSPIRQGGLRGLALRPSLLFSANCRTTPVCRLLPAKHRTNSAASTPSAASASTAYTRQTGSMAASASTNRQPLRRLGGLNARGSTTLTSPTTTEAISIGGTGTKCMLPRRVLRTLGDWRFDIDNGNNFIAAPGSGNSFIDSALSTRQDGLGG